MIAMTEQTSTSDRYEAARKALAFNEAVDRGESVAERTARDNLAAALRALITPPSVGEDEGVIAERTIRSELGEDWPDRLYVMNIYDLAEACVRAGIQSAHETWEPEVAIRPTQEQMLRWLAIDCTIHVGNIFIPEQTIERED